MEASTFGIFKGNGLKAMWLYALLSRHTIRKRNNLLSVCLSSHLVFYTLYLWTIHPMTIALLLMIAMVTTIREPNAT